MSHPTQRVVVMGASHKPERYSNQAVRLLREHGHQVVPVHPRLDTVEGLPVAHNLREIDGKVDTLTLYVGPAISSTAAEAIVRLTRVFQIATQKVEYVDEMATVRERHLQMRRDHLAVLARLLRAAQRRGDIVPAPPARQLAIGLHALVDGLIQNWMLDPASFALRAVGCKAVEAHLAGLSLPALPAGPGSGRSRPPVDGAR